MTVRSILFSWDILVATSIAILLWFVLPNQIDHSLVSTIYNVGISVLAIVFSVFFTALAVIVSASDNEFVEFMEEDQAFSGLIVIFRFSLILLFLALAYAAVMFVATAFWQTEKSVQTQPSGWFVLFCWLFCYSLFATASSSLDTIKFAQNRITFIRIMKRRRTKHDVPTEREGGQANRAS